MDSLMRKSRFSPPSRTWLLPNHLIAATLLAQVFFLSSKWFRWFGFNQHEGWTFLSALIVLGVAALVAIIWFVACLCARRPPQFGLSALFLLAVVLAIQSSWLATELQNARRREDAIQAIVNSSGYVSYVDDAGNTKERPHGPQWLRSLIGGDIFVDANHIGFNRNRVRNADLDHLAAFPHLRVLLLSDTRITDAGLSRLKCLRDLRDLTLPGTVTDAGLENLKNLKTLESLDLSNNSHITDKGLRLISGLSSLRDLNLADTSVTCERLPSLEGLAKLETLSLNRTRVTDAGLRSLGALAKLRDLCLDDTSITGAGLGFLPAQLEELSLVGTRVSDASLKSLSRLTKLRELSLDHTPIVGSGLKSLCDLQHLERCSLSFTQLNDDGLAYLGQFKSLVGLPDMQGTRISETGIRTFLKTHKMFLEGHSEDAIEIIFENNLYKCVALTRHRKEDD